jgi:hypothetical protein
MAVTTRSDVIVPELLQDAVAGAFAGMKCLAGTGAAVIGTGLPGDKRGGDTVTVPYFGNLGELEDVAENVALTPQSISMSSETSTVRRSGKAFEATRWAQTAAMADPYAEAQRQFREMIGRRADKALIDAAVASACRPRRSPTCSARPRRPRCPTTRGVNGRMVFGDESDSVVGAAVHSKVFTDLLKLKDGEALPLLTSPTDGGISRFVGVPLIVSDRAPVEYGVTSAGTTPPTVALTGNSIGKLTFSLEVTTGGTRGTAIFKWSSDGGTTYTTGVTTAATVVLGDTGITATFAAGTYATDNVYTSVAKYVTVLFRRGALAFWYNESPRVLADTDILVDADVTAVHVYWAAHRYSRLPGSTKSGIALIKTN